ncbi:MAG: succinylglutamate desuccinylase/aspartoacylase family protein [Sporomusaceae bacterium]|nr:succinylglutamate desuccinylase/aspartoacylase family protein [Sporomusaceae bacterium]
MVGTKKTALALLAGVVAILILVTPQFTAMHSADTIKKGPGVTAVKMLSDYFAGLKNTPGDTAVYVLDSGKPGGTVLVVGGTHPNEPSGYIGAILLVEKARPTKGKLIVIPQANASGFTHNDYSEGSPQRFALTTPGGERSFRYGSRATNPIHQWPDPDIYVHAASGQKLSGSETRNLNRAYPGRPDGTLTEQIAYGIVELIRQEKVNLAVDLHEASPEYPVINALVFHERAMDVAAVAALDLEMEKIKIGLEPSPKTLRGLSHREWGDATQAMAVLMETGNPAQGRLRGATNEALVVTGQDRMYERAAKLGRLFIPYDKNGQPLSLRVARHVAATMVLIRDSFEKDPRQAVVITGVPSFREIVTKGVGAFL